MSPMGRPQKKDVAEVEKPQRLEWNEATFHLLHPQLTGVVLLADLAKEGVSISEYISAIAPEDLGSWPNTLLSAQVCYFFS